MEEQFMSSFSNRLKEDVIPTMFPVVQPAFDKSSIFSTQEHEPVFTGKHIPLLISALVEQG